MENNPDEFVDCGMAPVGEGGANPATAAEPTLKKGGFVLRVMFASYDEIPDADDVLDAVCEGITDLCPNITINAEIENKEGC